MLRPGLRRIALALLLAPIVAPVFACYGGSARDASPAAIARDPDWEFLGGVPFVAQQSDVDCGAAALAMVLSYHGRAVSAARILAESPPRDGGITAGDLRDDARRLGLSAFLIAASWDDLEGQLIRGRPILVGLLKPVRPAWAGRATAHYEVVVGFNRRRRRILTLDPASGLRENTVEGFAGEWAPAGRLALVMFPRPPSPGRP